jgi:PKHD-type hydroxylase
MNNTPRYGINQRTFPYLSHCELYNAFGNGQVVEKEGEPAVYKPEADECLKIKELGELMVFQAGSVGNNEQNKDVRDSQVAWINDDPNLQNLDDRRWLLQRIADTIGMVNRDKFQLDLDHFFPMQFTKYGLNQHYDWHVDVHEGAESNEHRKLSAVLMLTDPSEYEGGELELNIGGNPDNCLRLKPPAGTVVFFYSHIPHRVLPVTKGDRASLVIWALGPKVR